MNPSPHSQLRPLNSLRHCVKVPYLRYLFRLFVGSGPPTAAYPKWYVLVLTYLKRYMSIKPNSTAAVETTLSSSSPRLSTSIHDLRVRPTHSVARTVSFHDCLLLTISKAVLREPQTMFGIDINWWGLALPFSYLIVLVGSLMTFSTIYRKRKAGPSHTRTQFTRPTRC